MSSQRPFSIAERADDLDRRWGLFIQPEYQKTDIFRRIATELYTIPITPLPNSSVSGAPDLGPDTAIHEFEFFDTWHEYQQALAEYGTICYSRFQAIQLFNEAPSVLSRKNYGIRIDLKLPSNWGAQLYFLAYVYADGRVGCFGMDANRYQNYSQ